VPLLAGDEQAALLDSSSAASAPAPPTTTRLVDRGRATPFARTRKLGGGVGVAAADEGGNTPEDEDGSKDAVMSALLVQLHAAQEAVEERARGSPCREVPRVLFGLPAMASALGVEAAELASATLPPTSSTSAPDDNSTATPSDDTTAEAAHHAGTTPLVPAPPSAAVAAVAPPSVQWPTSLPASPSLPASSMCTSVSPPPPAPLATALVVDDSATNVKIIVKILAGMGCAAVVAFDGQQAVEAVKTKAKVAVEARKLRAESAAESDASSPAASVQFDIIFSDVLMPVLDGLESCRLIRVFEREHQLQTVPVVALTANAMSHDQQACFEAGMTHFLSKVGKRRHMKACTAYKDAVSTGVAHTCHAHSLGLFCLLRSPALQSRSDQRHPAQGHAGPISECREVE
jgi:CheY-like chemotaxis protein